MFTLNGGHVWPFYDAAVKAGMPIYDTRHEQTATFAAEGTAKLTRRPGLAVLTAGPGVTNGVSAVTSAWFNGSPLVVLGGRAPQGRWGHGSLQEFDHVPLMAPITKLAATALSTGDIAKVVHEAVVTAATSHRGPVFVDIPMDVFFAHGEADVPAPEVPRGADPDPDEVARAAALVAGAERPALVAGSDVWWDGASDALRRCVEALRIPTFVNGLGRGCLPADHELAFARTRGLLKEADVVVVVGTPLDFRLSFGRFGDAKVVHVVDSAGAAGRPRRCRRVTCRRPVDHPRRDGRLCREPDRPRGLDGPPARRGDGAPGGRPGRAGGGHVTHPPGPRLRRAAPPPRPRRGRRRRRRRLRLLRRQAGRLLRARLLARPRPVRLPRHRPRLRHGRPRRPPRQPGRPHARRRRRRVQPDGRRHLVRHGLPVVMVVGNNGIWGLEKHPMQADLRLRRGRRPPARLPLRRRGEGPRRRRRDGHRARAMSAPRSTAPSPAACPTSSTSSPTPR